MSIKNVALVGATGNLGPAVYKALVEADFNVTILTRGAASKNHVHTDYSPDSLALVLKGQDAVVSTIASSAVTQQQVIIDAAVKAGVKRFIPSEFGVNTQRIDGGIAKILAGKKKIQEQLEAAVSDTFSWTGVSTNLFFNWGLKSGSLGFSIPSKTATIFDSGNEPFTGTNLDTIGRAVASILKHPKETANKYIDIASFITTQNEILSLLEEETGTKWNVVHKNTDESLKVADDKLSKGDYSAFGDYLKVLLFKDGKGQSAKESQLSNKLLELPQDDLRGTIKAAL